ncbi:hypothetical protein [Pseudomonas aeruginosa]|uniref:hypothetical protein n=1 Tax=Pseudomonas aeruginosa TaxID=287 RepID=UPI0003E3C30D|nr:hypothetical protein BN889_02143 [Pseudomonas aeruginosa PA38182]SST12265.1 Uncharacterised protein [Acinetobacter baumannii]
MPLRGQRRRCGNRRHTQAEARRPARFGTVEFAVQVQPQATVGAQRVQAGRANLRWQAKNALA